MGKGIAIGCGFIAVMGLLFIGGCFIFTRHSLQVAHEEIEKSKKAGIVGEKPKDPSDHWTDGQETLSPMDHKRSLSITTSAINFASTGMFSVPPELEIRCRDGKVEADVETVVVTQSGSVRIKFDDRAPIAQQWHQATSYTYLFAPNARQLANELKGAHLFTFEFTQFQHGKLILMFNVEGLDKHLQRVFDACADPGRR